MAKFERGEQVEICCKDEGFLGSYYPATVVARIDPDDYIIEYHTLLTDDELRPLREMISGADLRPLPPEIPADGFDVGDEVDAYANDGWWKGKVAKKLSGRGKLYLVLFEGGGVAEESKYSLSELRLHQDWVHGNWIRPQKFL